MSQEVVIVGGARTPMCEYVGTPGFGKLKTVSAIDLAAHSSKAALERSKVAADSIDHVVVGNALQTSQDAIYGARHVGLKAGVPKTSPALTVNRLCGSGIQSVVNGAQMIQLGEAKTVLAGGMENMSQAPFQMFGGREGYKFGTAPQLVDQLFGALMDPLAGLMMAQTAEKIAKRLDISREAQDEYAYRSHMLGAKGGRGRSLRGRDRAGPDRDPSRRDRRRHRRPHQAGHDRRRPREAARVVRQGRPR